MESSITPPAPPYSLAPAKARRRWREDFYDHFLDGAAGVTVAGHSAGGESSLFAASLHAAEYNIKSAVLHHYFPHDAAMAPLTPTVPTLLFTGTTDCIAPPSTAVAAFEAAAAAGVPTGLVNKVDADHHEPASLYPAQPFSCVKTPFNPQLGLYTVAWAKLWQRTPRSLGIDWEGMLYGAANSSLCGGGDGALAACNVTR